MIQLNEEQKKEVAQLALDRVLEHKLSISKLATDAKLNAGEMSFVLGRDNADSPYKVKFDWNNREIGGKKQPLSDRFWVTLADFVGYSTRPVNWREFDFLNTQIILNKIQETREQSKTCWIQGQVGMSKSYTVGMYQTLAPHYTYVVKGVRCSPKAFAVRIAKSLGLKHIQGHTYEIMDDVITYLRQNVSQSPIVVFDESENLSLLSWEIIKYLFDGVQGKCALVILSANDIIDKFKKKYAQEKAVFSQIFSRFNNVMHLLPVHLDEVKEVCEYYNIHSKKLQKRIFDHSTDYRILADTVQDILTAHQEGKMELTVEAFEALY